METYDIVTIGGGIVGAALAKVMAEQGCRVLVVEPARASASSWASGPTCGIHSRREEEP